MENNTIWNSFTEKIQKEVEPMLYQTWFGDLKILSIDDKTVKIIVPMQIHKKRLTDFYNDLVKKTFYEILGYPVEIEYITGDDSIKNISFGTNPVEKIAKKQYETKIKEFDVIIISDYKKGLLNIENTAKLIEIANEYNKITLIDTKEPSYAKYKNAYLIKPNLDELKNLTKMSVNNDEEIVKAANELRTQTGAKYVLATRSKDGMTLVDGKSFKHIRGVSKEVYDVSGAGDTVISYLAVGLANNFAINDTARLANIASSIEVSKMGTYAVSIEEIKEHINKENDVVYDEKLPSVDELVKILQIEREKGKKIVFTNGCFDIFHVGHLRYLKESSKYGDMLILGVNSDASVKRLEGENRPIVSEKERAELLASLSFVSYIVLFDEDTPYEIIKRIKPDIITKGGDYKPEDVVGKDIVDAKGGKVVICPLTENKSTTNIINKILEVYHE